MNRPSNGFAELVESIRFNKKYLSSFNEKIQKRAATEMWYYVRDHLDELEEILTDEEIDSGDIEYGYEALDRIKREFADMFRRETGIGIDWRNLCFLCSKYRCCHIGGNCPLESCDSKTDNPYHTIVEFAFRSGFVDMEDAKEACNKIIRTLANE